MAATKKGSSSSRSRVSDVCSALEALAPLERARSWDNVGLLAGDPNATVRRVLLCIDLTADVLAEAIRAKVDLVVAYHPPIFRPISRLSAASRGTDAQVFGCVSAGIAIYSPHTALDCADGGTNDVLAGLCGAKDASPIEFVDDPGRHECKVVVFVPAEEVDTVAEAMFAAGAGRIGEYAKCSYRVGGQGTFLGSDATRPTIGQAGRFERVDEIRLETVVPRASVPAVVDALRQAHSYEEPAFDIYPLRAPPVRGAGRCGRLPRPIRLLGLARKLKRATQANCVQIVGDAEALVSRAICMVGAAGNDVFRAGLGPGDVVVTGEIRHHDALAILRCGAGAMALNHWTSERPALRCLGERLAARVPGLDVRLSKADREPFTGV
jgi:dinuclear metal center YbgI/SA1388 family protein